LRAQIGLVLPQQRVGLLLLFHLGQSLNAAQQVLGNAADSLHSLQLLFLFCVLDRSADHLRVGILSDVLGIVGRELLVSRLSSAGQNALQGLAAAHGLLFRRRRRFERLDSCSLPVNVA